MGPPKAVLLALELYRAPALVEAARRQDLPERVDVVIRLAGGCETALGQMTELTGAASAVLRRAAVFYVQHVLLHPQADSYRVLGAAASASPATLRANRNWLLRWLHPDRDCADWESAHARRVIEAWDDLKTPERRQHYDRRLAAAGRLPAPNAGRRPGRPWVAMPRHAGARRSRRRIRDAALASIVAGGLIFVPGPDVPSPWAEGVHEEAAIRAHAEARDRDRERQSVVTADDESQNDG